VLKQLSGSDSFGKHVVDCQDDVVGCKTAQLKQFFLNFPIILRSHAGKHVKHFCEF